MRIRLATRLFTFLVITQIASAETVYKSAAPDPTSIAGVVNEFRAIRTGCNAELNWEDTSDDSAAPYNLTNPFDRPFETTFGSIFGKIFFGKIFFSSPGFGFQVSAAANNPTGTPVRFGNINPIYPKIFQAFSPERLFTPLGNNSVVITFSTAAAGFGAVFTNVKTQSSTWLEFLDNEQRRHGPYFVPPADTDGGLSFLGVVPNGRFITAIHMHVGDAHLDSHVPLDPLNFDNGNRNSFGPNVVAVDDLIFKCPLLVSCPPPSATPSVLCGAVNAEW